MTATKSRSAAKKSPSGSTSKAQKLTKAQIEHIDASIENARGKPGFEMVRALGELAKLGPYSFKKIKV